MALWEVTITVDVQNPDALWSAAREQFIAESVNLHGGRPDDATIQEVIGAQHDPDIRACLIMVLDRSDHLGDGGDIEGTEATCLDDEDDGDALDFDDGANLMDSQ